MSFPQDPRRRRGGAGTGFSSTGRRTAMGYWIPLALTVGVATLSVAAWIWSERDEDDDEDDRPHDGHGPYPPPPPGTVGSDFPPPAYGAEGYARSAGVDIVPGDTPYDPTFMGRMQGALRRTPSPQQLFDGASRKVAAGVTAAGAFVGNALTSIREENRGDFEDHTRWSEEAQSRATERGQQTPTMSGALPTRGPVAGQQPFEKKKKTVAIVVSSLSPADSDEFASEHASILSHLPEHVDLDSSRIFVLIYGPDVKHAVGQGSSSRATHSIASSYSNIATEEANSSEDLPPKDLQTVEPRQEEELDGHSPFFKTLYTQAQALVDKENMIMPFSTASGYVHLVRHLSPDLVYVQESLTGNEGEAAQHISGWVRQVIVVVGDEGGRGGLIDSDDESALADKGERWWQKEGTTGIGKRIDVVDVLRVGDDWRHRVNGHD
ncbi:hypothetical protein N7532_007032 [Penicillium argentinense]|uniref:Peroxin 22-like protein n=1 Tax=Penicillium argentinense TaxID=1131581 RepID=A0A9W9FH11_9EURO|nr:uncharacterized protein N7532_007032 [Penicillium argentinense]KAJ5100031.1 hypothetical protein N7532_007032 [Penicillium argentinense]